MDFNFKKSRNTKRKEDKSRSAHRFNPTQKNSSADDKSTTSLSKHHSDPGALGKPAMGAETNPASSQSEEHETVVDTKLYSRRTIVNNWERYELPTDSPDEESSGALDFESIINSLSDVQGHLKLSHEQDWGKECSELQEEMFNIDMHKLCESIERVPFHVRQNMPASMFDAEQLGVFEQDAEEALKQMILSKLSVGEDSLLQSLCEKAAELSTSSDSATKPSLVSTSPVIQKTEIEGEKNIEESRSSNHVCEDEKTQVEEKISQTTVIKEKSAPSEGPNACSKEDELDLDFLLSLDTAVSNDSKTQQIGALEISAVTGSNSSNTDKLDDWLDDLLDD